MRQFPTYFKKKRTRTSAADKKLTWGRTRESFANMGIQDAKSAKIGQIDQNLTKNAQTEHNRTKRQEIVQKRTNQSESDKTQCWEWFSGRNARKTKKNLCEFFDLRGTCGEPAGTRGDPLIFFRKCGEPAGNLRGPAGTCGEITPRRAMAILHQKIDFR